MPRKSVEQLTVVMPPTEWPSPPAELTEEQTKEWKIIVHSMPPNFFSPEMFALIEDLCFLICHSRELRAEISKLDVSSGLNDEELNRYEIFCRIADRETTSIARIATKLRLTPQSRYAAHSAHRAAKKAIPQQPWEIRSVR